LTITNLELGTEPLFTGFMRDLSEQKKLEQTKANFFGNVSHEMRTPLHLILEPAVDALQDHEQPLPARQRERLTLIHSNALRLLKLANSVLDFSKIEAGQLQANYEPVDLVVLTAELVEAFRTAIEKAGLTLQVNLTLLEEPVYVDKDMWERMVFNLLSNALKYTAKGGITITLK
jgi:signal transduction histidine kinase